MIVRRAEPRDVEFLLELVSHPDVEPFLGPATSDRFEDRRR